MNNIILSGGEYGGANLADFAYTTEDNKIFNVNGWLYSTEVSVTPDTADFIGMA